MMGRTLFRWHFTSLIAAFLLLRCQGSFIAAAAPKSSHWKTLSGFVPAVVAKGGFSGLFPDSSSYSYKFTSIMDSFNTISWCDVQLIKDGTGRCLPNMNLDSCTNIAQYFPDGNTSYVVNGILTAGWFSLDYDAQNFVNVSVIQGIGSRTPNFNDHSFQILSPDEVYDYIKPAALWLNIEHEMFYREHGLSMRKYVLSLLKRVPVSYISSPEVAFLRGMASSLWRTRTKLFFRFLGEETVEPSTNQTYGFLLKNLTFIKTFASGILVPKNYIWPVTSDFYLEPHTSIVSDAHKEGLEVYASGFANDDPHLSYNYSYDPLSEVLQFIDNGDFSVDGIVTDFSRTASAAIGCYSHMSTMNNKNGNTIIISHNGASGIYPDCTDLAYLQAVEDGADYIDCTVHLTQDGIPICMSSINLVDATNVATSILRSRFTMVPELGSTPGIFTFNLTWQEIQNNLKPSISNPYLDYNNLLRNTRNKDAGNFTRLIDFLDFAKSKNLSGIVIIVEDAAFYAEKIGYSITDAVIGALKDAGYSNQTTQQVMIQSTNSSVLVKFKEKTTYKLLYNIHESVGKVDRASLRDIKGFANAVAISRQSVYPASELFIEEQTDIVQELQSAGLPLYVYLFRNEFLSQPWDFLSDPSVEIDSYVQVIGVDGVITDYPATASRYLRNPCLKLSKERRPSYMQPVPGGQLLQFLAPLPPALAPMPVLDVSDVEEPPLSPVSPRPLATGFIGVPPAPSSMPRKFEASSFVLATMVFFSFLF
ncbi:hypothetical protein HPP92_002463 [Vanilla planifolia]|uniref:glycerophosphodiester phosphodiesterase n=1 Tax=Vanilla planifolia TaxID=51239 RepID=A0A835VMT0_VANPL|nr:hypothetical protein HPP92_002463 [Vanilla planifolia]